MISSRSDGYSRYSHTNSKRSMFQSHARRGLAPKNYQLLAQEEIFGLKPRSPRSGERKANSSWVRNATIGRFITIRPPARHPG